MSNPGFGDNVQIRTTPLTEQLGFAGLIGSVYGETTPSVTCVEVIGEVTEDFALNVMLNGRDEQLWFAPHLIELVDHAAGTRIRIGNREMVRRDDGEWDEVPGNDPPMKKGFVSWLMRSFAGRQ